VVWTMAVMTLLVFCQVVMRYVFRNSLSWSEELARFIFMWLSWIGASYAVKERSHFRVEMFADLMKGRGRVRFELLILVVWFAFAAIMTWLGTRLTIFLMERRQVSSRDGNSHVVGLRFGSGGMRADGRPSDRGDRENPETPGSAKRRRRQKRLR